MSLKIFYENTHGFKANIVKVAAALSGAEYEVVQTTSDEFKESKGDKFTLPYIEVEEQGLSEVNTILRHIARLHPDSGLYGKTLFENALVDTVMDYTITLLKATYAVGAVAYGHAKATAAEFKANKEKYVAALKHLEELLAGKDFFVGDAITIADIKVAGICVLPFRVLMDPGTSKQIPNLLAHFERISGNESFKKFFGTTHVAKRPIKIQFTKEEKKVKEEKKQAPKKAEPKPKSKLETLPPTTMDLNEFKYWFINHTDRDAAFDEFYTSKLDKEGWSFWELNYIKYPGEGEQLWKTNNLLNGFIQRAEPFGKWSYGVQMIYGEEPNLDMKGVWMWRGHEIPQELKDHAQFDYYTTKKLDIDNAEDRAYIKDVWTAKDGPMKDGTIIANWSYQK